MALRFKRGNIPIDLILVMVIFITILSMFVIVAWSIVDGIEQPMQDAGFNTSALDDTKAVYGLLNTGIPFIFFSFVVISILLAWYLRTSPIISIFMVIIISVVGYIAQAMSNTFFEFSRNPAMTDAANELNYIVYIQDNLGLFLFIIGVVVVVFMFAKPKSVSM